MTLSTRRLSRSLSQSSSMNCAINPVIPFARRRLRPDQIQTLQTLYDLKSHPSKDERARLARELDMEMKAVTIWFQNKRRSMKKKSIAWSRATALMSENSFGLKGRRLSTPANPPMQKSILRRHSSLNLDMIASAHEVKDTLHAKSSRTRAPLTPRKNIPKYPHTDYQEFEGPVAASEKSDLWEHLLSSPPMPPSSPAAERILVSALPPKWKSTRSLEWACAKDRAGRKKKPSPLHNETGDTSVDTDVPGLDLDCDDTHTESDDELMTPDMSMTMPVIELTPPRHRRVDNKDRSRGRVPAEDVEAAMALLGFRVHKQS